MKAKDGTENGNGEKERFGRAGQGAVMLYRLLLGGLNSIRTPGHMKTGRPVPSGERPTHPRIVSQSIQMSA